MAVESTRPELTVPQLAKALRYAVLAAALALGGCETVGSINTTQAKYAELESDHTGQSENLSSLGELIARNPQDASAYNTRGAAYAKLGRYQDAVADFTRAVTIDPNLGAAYTNRALAYRQAGNNEAALAAIPKLLPDSMDARRKVFPASQEVLSASAGISGEIAKRLAQVAELFGIDDPEALERRNKVTSLDPRAKAS